MSDLNELIAEAELGEEARRFLDSDLGRCILGIAEQEIVKCEKELGRIDPKDIDGITRLQREIRLYENFPNWLVELLHNGENALSIYQQEKK